MEEKSASCPEGAVSWYIRTSRLAVALAIIKLRPPGGARQFTESLAERLKRQNESWKSKAEGLHEDLLHLRQELLLTRTLLNTRSSAGQAPGHEIAKVLSQDDTRAVNSACDAVNTSQTQGDSAPGPCLPPTPPNSQKFTLKDKQWCQDHRLMKHVQFLQCLSGLRSGFEESLCQDGDVVWDSVVQLLDCAVEDFRQAHTGQPLRHHEQLHNAIQVVAQTLSPGGARQGFPVQHFSKVEDLLKEMINLLLTNQQLNAFSVQGSLSECLLALGGNCCITRTPLIQLLMSQIIQLAQQLWDACEKSSQEHEHHQVDWVCYQNSFYVFWLLERLAQDSNNGVNQELVVQLETKAFPLADEFSLFSLYMWRIGGLFRAGNS
ncbi:meiosis-specific protein MEI4 [Danio aesculapii]|uniref:meiosis-specific protein MEI4 n=1 Tax=Danio aesculapii TaxID=1142201 RepID=UPI0024C0D6CF|nr:meiosis-specific protein MEI4 [Danio aesculapii]